jgi:hypothetical protein
MPGRSRRESTLCHLQTNARYSPRRKLTEPRDSGTMPAEQTEMCAPPVGGVCGKPPLERSSPTREVAVSAFCGIGAPNAE